MMAVASIRRITVAASLAALLAVPSAVAAAAVPVAGAQPSPAPSGSLFLSTDVPAAGAPLFFLGMGYLPGERVLAALTGAGYAPPRDAGHPVRPVHPVHPVRTEDPEYPEHPEHPEPAGHVGRTEEETRPPADEADSGPGQRLRRVVRADRLGVARGRIRLPARLRPGRYLFSLTGLTSHQRLYSFLTIRSRQGYAGTPAGNGAASASGARPEAAAASPARPGAVAQAGPTPVSLVAAPISGDVAPARPAGALTTAAIVAGGLAALGSGAWLLRRRRRERDWRV